MSMRRTALLGMGFVAASSALAGEKDRFRDLQPRQPSRPALERAGPCQAYGPGFQAIPGTTSCVKVFGRVQMDATRRYRR